MKINTENPNFFFGYALAGTLVSILGYLFIVMVDKLNANIKAGYLINIKAGYLIFGIIGSICIFLLLLVIIMNKKNNQRRR